MAKRAYGAAFATANPAGLFVSAGDGSDALQSQLHPAPSSPSFAFTMPGQWPLDASFCGSAPALEPPQHSSFFTTVTKLATAVSNITNLFALPLRIAQRFLHHQQIRADPVVRPDGARKKRLVDAGLAEAPVTPSRSRRVRSHASHTVQQSEALDIKLSQSPGGWPMEQDPEQPFATVPASFEKSYADWTPSPASKRSQQQFMSSPNGSDIDDSLDFSFSDSDILTSSTPPFSKTGSPVQQSWNSPSSATPGQPVRAMPPLNSSTNSMSNVTSQHHSLKYAPVTPVRRQLLRKQLRATDPALCSPPSPHADHTTPSQSPRVNTPTKIQEHVITTSILKINSADVAKNAQKASELYKAARSPQMREIRNAEAQATSENDGLDPVITTTEELSFLLDADASFNYANDLSELPDAPSPPLKKSVRWAPQNGVKSFYIDARVSEMLDSTLEEIASSPTKRPSPVKRPSPSKQSNQDAVAFEDPVDDSALSDVSSVDGPSVSQLGTSPESVGFHGVPDDTWDTTDNSLEELELSQELVSSLQADLLAKLLLEPPPPPEKPLVAPLTDAEADQLEAAAKKTGYGRLPVAPVVPDKLNARDFGTLLPHKFDGNEKAWLNDEIVNEYLAIMVSHKKKAAGFVKKSGGPAPPVHAFSSYFFASAEKSVKSVERWAGRVQLKGAQYLDADLILYPICHDDHWRLLAVKPKERLIVYLDSLGWGGDKHVNIMRNYLKQELGDLYNEEEWVVAKNLRSSKQLNGSDCGVFVLMNALVLLRGDDCKKVIASKGMMEARERIAVTLLAGQPTTEMD